MMKHLLVYALVIIISLLTFSANSDDNLQSGIKIDKSKKVKFTDCSKKNGDVIKKVGMDMLGASFFQRSSKINDLRGDGVVYYKFRNPWVNNSRYYLHGKAEENEYHRLDKNYKVISQGTFKCTANKNVFELTEDNQKFLWKVSVPNQIVDIKSKIYNYKGYRRYQFAVVTNEDENLIYKAVNDHKKNNNYAKVDSGQDNVSTTSLKSGLVISKKEKVEYLKSNNSGYWQFMQFKINDLRGDGIVFYDFDVDKYYRINEKYEVVEKGSYKFLKDKKIYQLTTQEKQKFLFKISIASQVVDIKSKVYDYKGYRRYQLVLADTNEQEQIRSSIKNFENNQYVKVDSGQNNVSTISLKSGLVISEKEKKPLEEYNYSGTFLWNYSFLIDDLRGDGPVYYVFNIDQYHRLDKNFNVLSKGTFVENKRVFELKEDKLKFKWKISLVDKIIDIKSTFYDYKGYRRYQIKETTDNQKKLVSKSISQSKNNQYVKIDSKIDSNIDSTKDIKSSFGYVVAKTYDDSDDNLNRLWKLILADKDIEKKYLKYSKRNAKFKGKPIRAMALAVFIDYKKELSILTKDIYTKKLSSPIAWGWEYSYEDPVKIKGFNENKTVFGGFEAIRNCYKSVRKKKLSLRDGECILVDLRRITGGGQYPVIWYNYLIESKKNQILLAEASEKSKQQIANEKKEEEKKKKTLLLAQKKAEEERKQQEKILAEKKKEEEKRKKELLLAQKKAEEERKKQEKILAEKKKEEEIKEQELILAQKKAEEEKKKQELLLAQKKAEEERKKQELLLAQKKAEEEKKKQELLLAEEKAKEEKKKQELIAKLKEQEQKKLTELELAKKEAEKEFEKKKKELNIDKESPEILVAEAVTVSSQVYKLKGKVKDKSEFFLEIDGQPVKINNKGEFIFEGFIIDTDEGEELTLVAIDRWNNSSEKSVKINVEIKEAQIAKTYEKLLPSKIKTKQDSNKVALVIGVEKYENLVNLDAIYANRDAKAFRAYANRAFGIPLENIKVLIDKEASRSEILKATKLWLPQLAKGGGKDIYIFFAGHGLASDDGENLFLLPQDGDSLLLEDTALSRTNMFKQISKLKPNSVTIFFDTCYSGQTRSEETLIAGLRPVRLVVEEQDIPNNFTIFSASSLTQTSGSIEQAKHGIFSYYLMKGLEGNADTNLDNKITNGELIAYLKENVSEEAFINNRQQEPMLSGDPDKVLISYR